MRQSLDRRRASLLGLLLLTTASLPAAAQLLGPGTGSGLGSGSAGMLGPASGVDARLERLERMLNEQSLSDLVLQIQRLQQEVQELRGQVEMQQYRLQQQGSGPSFGSGRFGGEQGGMPWRGPIGAPLPGAQPGGASDAAGGAQPVEPGARPGQGLGAPAADGSQPAAPGSGEGAAAAAGESAPAVPPPQGVGALGRGSGNGGTLALPSPETTAGGEREAYRTAFELLKDRDYPASKEAFAEMLSRYPQGQFTDNGRYWLGEIGYVTKDYASALAEFNRLVTDYPLSPKVPSALLKLGYIYADRNDEEQARMLLQQVVERFPDTTEGRLAQGRLQQMSGAPR